MHFRRHAMLYHISIHAPRAGSDGGGGEITSEDINFNPRSPCGERRIPRSLGVIKGDISIHAPRAGSDSRPSL